MSLESSIVYFVAILVFAVTPGPGVFAVMARSMTSDASRCLPLVVGLAVSDVLYLIFACRGLAIVAENWNHVFTVIRILGAVYLFYLGWRMWTAPVDDGLSEKAERFGGNSVRGFAQGFLISASNPKVILFYIAFLPTFMDVRNLGAADLALAGAITFTGLVFALMAIASGVGYARRYLRSARALRRLNRTAGGTMMGAGALLAVKN